MNNNLIGQKKLEGPNCDIELHKFGIIEYFCVLLFWLIDCFSTNSCHVLFWDRGIAFQHLISEENRKMNSLPHLSVGGSQKGVTTSHSMNAFVISQATQYPRGICMGEPCCKPYIFIERISQWREYVSAGPHYVYHSLSSQ